MCEYVLEFYVKKHETRVRVVGFYICILILARYKNENKLKIVAILFIRMRNCENGSEGINMLFMLLK